VKGRRVSCGHDRMSSTSLAFSFAVVRHTNSSVGICNLQQANVVHSSLAGSLTHSHKLLLYSFNSKIVSRLPAPYKRLHPPTPPATRRMPIHPPHTPRVRQLVS
jgi:hypothetical protein